MPSTRRRYQTLPNLKALRRKKSKEYICNESQNTAEGAEEDYNVFEGLFSSLAGSTPLGRTRNRSREKISRSYTEAYCSSRGGGPYSHQNGGTHYEEGKKLGGHRFVDGTRSIDRRTPSVVTVDEGYSNGYSNGHRRLRDYSEDYGRSLDRGKRVDGRREMRGVLGYRFGTPEGRVEGRGATRLKENKEKVEPRLSNESTWSQTPSYEDNDDSEPLYMSLPSCTSDKAERLSEYEQYFASLLVDTHPDHPDYSELHGTQDRLGQLVARHEDDSGELERVQDLFPNDNLRLYEREPISQKMKGLIRKRSTTAARLQRAFSAKGARSPDPQSPNNNNNNGDLGVSNGGIPTPIKGKEKPKRQFIMETPVHFTTGVQSQERHLFLFTDLLLVAKARSGGNFKLKEKVRVSEMWLATCMEDVVEVPKTTETSFVVGWPTTNVVASFSCVATKDLWYNKLSQVIQEERDKEAPSTTIQVTYYDQHTNTDICKTVHMSASTTARECVSLILDHLEMSNVDESKFQLWVKTQGEEAPYPLIGHELPFSIKMNCLRELLQECEMDQCNNMYNTDVMGRCQFILRQERKVGDFTNNSPEGLKKPKKARKSPLKLNRVFKRSNSKGDVTSDVTDGPMHREGMLFGQPLEVICGTEGNMPQPIRALLLQLLSKGPFTVGIFRKSANVRLVREVKEKLDNGEQNLDFDLVPILACAALIKEFFRALPDCLLCSNLYEEWLQVSSLETHREKVSRSMLLCSRLNRSKLVLLQHFLCVLHHIQRRQKDNMMSASNLAVCVGPSILFPSSPIQELSPEASKQAPAAVEFLIERCTSIFGKDILNLLGDPPEHDPLRQDSGAEESDSLHSSGGMRRDDSSIDSLERELIGEGELSPLPRKDKMSLTNLSRDSGLTMSDSQLYTPDEEESGSTSSSHSGGYKNGGSSPQQHSIPNDRFERPIEKFQHYTAPNNPNAIYTAVYRRPDKNINRYSDHDSYYASPNRDHTRVHITYSTPPNYNYPTQSPAKEFSKSYQDKNDSYNGYPKEEEEAIYSVPTGGSQNVGSNFQRHDWTRRCSNVKKVSRTGSNDGLTRSTSEESLLNKYNALEYGVSLCASGNVDHEIFNTGRALPPVPVEFDDQNCNIERGSPLRRSRSAYQVTEEMDCLRIPNAIDRTPERIPSREAVKFHRSRSTPQIHDEGDRSYDSSTLSDDDSTPHVSRSNSRGKECGTIGNTTLQAWDSGDSYNSRNSSFKSERTGSVCTVVSAGSTSTLSSNPPSYEEALSRRSLMQQNSSSPGGPGIPEYAIREEKIKSARAKQLYEESLRIYHEENAYPCDLVRASPARAHDGDDPPPLPPKSEPPPLPPKQRSKKESRRSKDTKSEDGRKVERGSEKRNNESERLEGRQEKRTEANSDKGRKSMDSRSEPGGRRTSNQLKHLPPVHVESPTKKDRSVSQIHLETPLHKTIIYTDDHPSPPILPPKERTIIEVCDSSPYVGTHNSPYVGAERMRKVTPSVHRRIEKKSIETQTDDCDLIDDDDKDIKDDAWDHVTSVPVPDTTYKRRGRISRKDSNATSRSRSMPGRETFRDNLIKDYLNASDSEDDGEWEHYGDARDFPTNTLGLKDLKQLDPDLQQEISWSVSQLRAIFGDSLKGAKVHPPPYRPPPNHPPHRAPITSYHLGAGDTFTSCRKQRPHSNYGEESYV